MLRRSLSLVYIVVGLTLCIIFYVGISFPEDIGSYFKSEFYKQFGRIVLAVELIIAGIHLLLNHKKTNFTMALFGFTAILDPVFNYLGILSSNIPVYGSIIYLCFAVVSLRIAFSNAFNSGKISVVNVVATFILGIVIELFFNSF